MDRFREHALLPLRIMVGFGFASHGYAKLARGPEQFASILAAMGVPLPEPTAWVTALLEFFGGISVMLGAFVAPLSVPLIVVMTVAMLNVHLRYGFSSVRLQGVSSEGASFGPVGFEINLLYIAGLVTLAWSRNHVWSLQRWINKTAPRATVHGARSSR